MRIIEGKVGHVANKAIEEGASARTARENLRRLRTESDLTWTGLSKMLADYGRKIPPISLRRIEDGDRRMDIDDLMALSFVLNVSPVRLLLPVREPDRVVEITGPGERHSEEAWSWVLSGTSIGSPTEGLEAGIEIIAGDGQVIHTVPEQTKISVLSEESKAEVRAIVREMLDREM